MEPPWTRPSVGAPSPRAVIWIMPARSVLNVLSEELRWTPFEMDKRIEAKEWKMLMLQADPAAFTGKLVDGLGLRLKLI